MGLFKKRKYLDAVELITIHELLTDIFNGKKEYKQTELDDALHLRMKVKEVLDSLKN